MPPEAPAEAAAGPHSSTTGTPGVRRARGVTIGVGGIAVLLAALDAYVVVTILGVMSTDMGIPINELEKWLDQSSTRTLEP